MTDKQKRFAEEYIVDCNAVRAYKAAYPDWRNENSVRTLASRLLTKVDIRGYIDELLEEMSNKKIAEASEVMEYLTSVMRGESTSSVVVVEGCGEGCSEAKLIEKSPDEKERLKAAELLGRRFGLFTSNVSIGGSVPVVISGGEELED